MEKFGIFELLDALSALASEPSDAQTTAPSAPPEPPAPPVPGEGAFSPPDYALGNNAASRPVSPRGKGNALADLLARQERISRRIDDPNKK